MTSAPVRLDLSGGPLFILTAMLLLTFAAVVAMAFNITGIMQSFALSNSAAGLIASVENLAIAISSLYVAQVAARLPARLIYTGGVLAVLAANGLTILADSVTSLVVLRAIAGLGAGSVTATVMYTAGHSATPEKTFGVINSFVGILGVLMAFVLPQALILHTRMDPALGLSAADGLYAVYFLAACAALLLVRWVPVPPAKTASDPADAHAASLARTPVPLRGWIALAGIGIVFFGQGTLGIYIVELGLATGLTSQAVGNAFAIASLFGIAAPLIGGWIGANYRATLPIAIVLAALILFAILLANNESAVGFYVLAPLYSIAPMMMLPIALGVLARIDSTGRLTGSHPAFVMLGGAAAPIVGGALRDISGGFVLTGWCVVACVVVGAVCMFRAMTIADAGRAAVPSAAWPGRMPELYLPVALGPVTVPQLALQDLAGRRFRERVHEIHRAGFLVGGQVTSRDRDDLFRGRGHARLQRDDRFHRFAPFVVGHSDDRGFQYRRVTVDRILDLRGIDVLAAGDDHVFRAIDDEHVAVFVPRREIARPHPAIPQCLRGQVRPSPVAEQLPSAMPSRTSDS